MDRIAIIGIGCRFPGGVDGATSYWSLLADGRCAIGEIPADRWSLAGFHDATSDLPHRSYSKWGGFLDDIGGFDAAWFGLSRREAEAMDPQQRLLLQVACEAAEDARLPLAELRRARAGVFIGVSNTDYGLLQRYRSGIGDIQAGTGTALSIVANRVSNRLDLSGPSMGVDTACSSSLVALDTACRHLRDGSCGMALAGGVNILLDPRMFVTFSRAHMLSPTGRIRAFDAGADGFVRGEGAGVVLLRPLDDALAAGDRIYAVIEATAVNQDGRTGTITEPSRHAQIAMIEAAVARARIGPGDVGYVEAHGTGTPVGDPIEVNAIGHVLGGHVLGGRERAAPLLIGSVKTNIGHLEPAAGIAGLIKAALVLHHGAIPPSLGFERPNPAIAFDDYNLAVVHETCALPEGKSHVLVNSFGFGGTNACAVLSSATRARFSSPHAGEVARRAGGGGGETAAFVCAAPPPRPSPARGEGGNSVDVGAVVTVPLSAPTPRHLQAFAATLADAIAHGSLAHLSVSDIAAALAAQHDLHTHRAVIIATSTDELRERLVCLAEGRDWPQRERHSPPEIIRGIAKPGRKVCFTMTGQGGQWWAMGRELIEREPVFRQTIEAFDAVFEPVGGWSVMEALLADEATSRIDDAAITPAVMFAFQTGLAEVWRARGVAPEIVLGHSFGEVTAAYLAGGLDARAIAGLVNQRGLIRHRVDRVGTMAAIGLSADEIAPLLPADGSIEIGGYNSPSMVTLTGEEAAIDALIARLNADDPTILTRKLALDFAYHSSWFEPVEQQFMRHVGTLATSPPRLPVVSTVTGQLNECFDAAYWWQNLRRPVRYNQAIDTALDLGADVFVELGPHRTLSSMTAACASARAREAVTVTSLDKRWGDLVSLAVGTGQLWVAGVEIEWAALLGGGGRDVELPRTPWLNTPLWLEPQEARAALRPAFVHPLLGRLEPGPGHAWRGEVSLASHAWLGDHRLDGACVFPAAAYLEMLTSAARAVLGAEAIELTDVAFPAALFIGGDDEIQLVTRFEPDRRRLTIHSRVRGGADDWVLRASAFAFANDRPQPSVPLAIPDASPVDVAAFYSVARKAGYGWGRQFQGLAEIAQGPGAARGLLRLPAEATLEPGFVLDPRLLDSALQLMLASGEEMLGAMPTRIDSVVVTRSLGEDAIALGRTRQRGNSSALTASIEIATRDGIPIARIEGLTARRRQRAVEVQNEPRFYRETFVPLDLAGEASGARTWIMLVAAGCEKTSALALGLGVDAVEIDAETAVSGERLAGRLRDLFGRQPFAGVIHALPISAARVADADLAAAAQIHAVQTIELGRALAILGAENKIPQVVVLTEGARVAGGSEAITSNGLAQSPVLAAARTIAMELPDLHLRLIDLDELALAGPAALRHALTLDTGETELAIRNGQVLAARLEEFAAGSAPRSVRSVRDIPSRANFALRHAGPPGADALHWRAAPGIEPAPGEVVVETHAVGLNFRDVMAVSGLLPSEAESGAAVDALGLELSGVVAAIGPGVTALAPGDRVLGMGRGLLRRHAALPATALQRLPPRLTHEEAATIPSAFLTAHYALNEIGRLQPGETVLIHSATGGVGLAAIALAKRAGARIIATAGTSEKRAHLAALGIADVFDSRSLAFADGVMQATAGRGVDVVLNSLGGPFIAKGLACLASYGRFLELGKRDVYDDAALGMKALRANASFHVIDVAALIEDRPQVAARMMGEILTMLNDGQIAPLPATVFDGHVASDAFRHFAAARHIGKVIVRVADPLIEVESALSEGAPLDPDGTYLVTGGTRGFGLSVGRWLAARGAGRVVLASRSGTLAAPVAPEIETMQLDVTSAADVSRVVSSLAAAGKPLRGIVHAAVTYDDALLPAMTTEKIARVLAPKITGALNLAMAIEQARAPLDFFVTFSSLAQTVGWPGQSNYAAANGFLEALAHWQRARGIEAKCIVWGALGESGHVARRAEMQSYLESSGWIGISDAAALAGLAHALDIDMPAVTIAAADWPRLAASHPALARSRRIAGLTAEGTAQTDAGQGLAGLEGARLAAAALELVRTQAARVLRSRTTDLAPEQTLAEAGIDSLSSFELHNRIEHAAGLAVPMPRYAKARRIGELADLLVALAGESRADARRK